MQAQPPGAAGAAQCHREWLPMRVPTLAVAYIRLQLALGAVPAFAGDHDQLACAVQRRGGDGPRCGKQQRSGGEADQRFHQRALRSGIQQVVDPLQVHGQLLLAVRIGVAEQHEQEIQQGVHGATVQQLRHLRRAVVRADRQCRIRVRAQRIGGVAGDGNQLATHVLELPRQLRQLGQASEFGEHQQHIVRACRRQVGQHQDRVGMRHHQQPEQRQPHGELAGVQAVIAQPVHEQLRGVVEQLHDAFDLRARVGLAGFLFGQRLAAAQGLAQAQVVVAAVWLARCLLRPLKPSFWLNLTTLDWLMPSALASCWDE
ncbi:hypothetical protein G6F35_012924 [Rhizopus arrhizus]|nr:hypothetical protein G6F35_012924 [Rhizopus arrhizus]